MIVGVGIDLVANRAIQEELERGAWQVTDGIFSPCEISRCSRARQPAMCYAACFAAKEATLKALGIGVADLGILREVEIERQPGGAYAVVLHRRTRSQARELGVRRVKLAVARSKKQTAAMAVLES